MHVVSTLEDARAALSGAATQLVSAPFAACHAGVNFYHAMLKQLRVEFPETAFGFTLCCGNDPAIAHDALRMGFKQVVCECGEGQFTELSEIAETLRAQVLSMYPLDAAGDAAKPIAKFA